MNKIAILVLMVGLIALAACSNNTGSSPPIQGKVTDSAINANQNAVVKDENVGKAPAVQEKIEAASSDVSRISDIKKSENIGKTFTVKGKVVSTMQTSTISGYKINDTTDAISISSPNVPQKGAEVTVTGTLEQSRYFGLIIKANN